MILELDLFLKAKFLLSKFLNSKNTFIYYSQDSEKELSEKVENCIHKQKRCVSNLILD